MKKMIANKEEAKRQIDMIEFIERDFVFIKKQYIAYELQDAMIKGGFVEAQYLGECTPDDRMGGCIPKGHYLDVKHHPSEDFCGVTWGCYLDDEFSRYEKKLGIPIESTEGVYLKNFNAVVDNFFKKYPAIKPEITQAWDTRPFTSELKSILRSVMSESEYEAWCCIEEQTQIQKSIPLLTNNTLPDNDPRVTAPTLKKKIKRNKI